MTFPAQTTYDRMAPSYNRRWAHYTDATLLGTLDGLALRESDRVLDLAMGTGELTRRLLSRWPRLRILGVDLSRRMLSLSVGDRVQGDAACLPFAAGVFEAVVCANAFHHFPDPEAALAEILRVLRPDGRLTLTDWCDDYLSCRLCSFWLHLTDRSFVRAYTLRQCQRLLEDAGFEVVAGRRFKIDLLWGLMRLEARRPGGNQIDPKL